MDIVEMSPVFELAEVRSTSNTYIQLMRRTETSDAQWVSEGGSRNESKNPTYGIERVDNFPLHALHLVTYEELEDAAVDLEGAVRAEIAEQFAKSFNKAFIEGNGADRPEGILKNEDVQSVPTGDSAGITAEGLIDLHYEIKTPYSTSDNSYFLMNRKTIREVRKLRDNGGDFIWQPGLAQDRQPTILESPYREATDLVEPDSDGSYETGEFPVLYGDFMEGYTISDRVQISIQRLVERFSNQGAIGFQARRRIGGQVTKPEALVKHRVAA
jgi:HK97 family phage major capsid protein